MLYDKWKAERFFMAVPAQEIAARWQVHCAGAADGALQHALSDLVPTFKQDTIGSVRRECLDHVSILSERHLRRVLSSYFTIIMTQERIFRSTRIAHGLAWCPAT